jgi:ubiquinone/menaquinone biosynthesis C-methylase UbiE
MSRPLTTNRLISRDEAQSLELSERVAIEAEITDALAEAADFPEIPETWSFEDYRGHSPWRRHMFDFLGPLEGREVLDLGCGSHPTPVYFALAGAARVVACDVSPKALERVDAMARHFGVADRVATLRCPAEEMPLPHESFDLVHGEAVLHHLDLPVASREIARVMKQGARGAFKDPLGENRLLELARDHVPYPWKHPHKGTDLPLTLERIEQFGKAFSYHSWRGFGLISMLVIGATRRRSSPLSRWADRVDERILSGSPSLQRWCRFAVNLVERGD